MKNVLCIKYYVVCIKVFAFLIMLNTCYLILATTPVEASALSLSIDPPIIVINAIPPTAVTSSLTIQNKADTEVNLQIKIKPFKAKGENGELEYLKDYSPIFKNIQIMDADLPVENIALGPRQKKNLTLNINISKETSISDYYFSILFISTNSSPIESTSSLNQIGIATNVLMSVGTLETPKAAIEEFSSNIFLEKDPVPFMIRIKNEGVHFIKPKGMIIIKNMFGQTIGRLDLQSANVLSDSIRAIPNVSWKESFLLGLYTATLSVSLSEEGPVFVRTIHFFAFPFQTLIIIVIIAITIIVIKNKLKIYMNKNRT